MYTRMDNCYTGFSLLYGDMDVPKQRHLLLVMNTET